MAKKPNIPRTPILQEQVSGSEWTQGGGQETLEGTLVQQVKYVMYRVEPGNLCGVNKGNTLMA
jgi:hypothetical protein